MNTAIFRGLVVAVFVTIAVYATVATNRVLDLEKRIAAVEAKQNDERDRRFSIEGFRVLDGNRGTFAWLTRYGASIGFCQDSMHKGSPYIQLRTNKHSAYPEIAIVATRGGGLIQVNTPTGVKHIHLSTLANMVSAYNENGQRLELAK